MKVSGCIVTYNEGSKVLRCIKSILEETKDIDFQLYICDNNSDDNTVELIKEQFPQVEVIINNDNLGFGAAHNKIINMVDSDYHGVINPDIILEMDVISELIKRIEESEQVGLVTPKILNMDGTEQYLPKKSPTLRYVLFSKFPGLKKYRRQYTRQNEIINEPTNVDFCTGCFFIGRTSYLKKLQGFDDRFYMYFEDADLSRRVINDNKTIIFDPTCEVYHEWHRDNTKSIKGILRFLSSMCKYFIKWGWKI